MKCLGCKYWRMGIPSGNCLHPEGNFQWTTDKMVFEGVGESVLLGVKK